MTGETTARRATAAPTAVMAEGEAAADCPVQDQVTIRMPADGAYLSVLRTATASGVREAQWRGFKGTDKGVDQPRAFRDGQPLFCEIWDADYFFDTFVGGFVLYPDSRDAAPGPSCGRRVVHRHGRKWAV